MKRGFMPTSIVKKAIRAMLRAGKPVCREPLDAEWLSIVRSLQDKENLSGEPPSVVPLVSHGVVRCEEEHRTSRRKEAERHSSKGFQAEE